MTIKYKQIKELANIYKTPLYIYDQRKLIENIKKIQKISSLSSVKINYATKANSNLHILKIINEHNMKVDSTGYGEYFINSKAGFSNEQIYVVANNLTFEELKLLCDENILISVDSVDQLKTLNQVAPGYQKLMLRVNPSFGAGENASIITGGANHKFGIDPDDINTCLNYIDANQMKLVGINQHIGSLNLDYHDVINAIKELLNVVNSFKLDDLEIINFGGGFGIDYNHETNEQIDFKSLKAELDPILTTFINNYANPNVSLEFEPGRYIVGNTAILVGTVTSIKKRNGQIFIGTDLGFSQLVRPVMYDSYHHIEFITKNKLARNCNVVGNMCESGDYLCKDRKLIIPEVGELVIVYDTGAYGYSMSSNFNNRLRPIEVMINNDEHTVIRKRETLESLLSHY